MPLNCGGSILDEIDDTSDCHLAAASMTNIHNSLHELQQQQPCSSVGGGSELLPHQLCQLQQQTTPNSLMGRQKRLRTSFKHHQLRIMKTYFALNHNPDAKDLKQLAQKTGLGKRILQVAVNFNLTRL